MQTQPHVVKILSATTFHFSKPPMQDEPANGILSSGVSCIGSTGVIKQNEGLGSSSDVEHMKSANQLPSLYRS